MNNGKGSKKPHPWRTGTLFTGSVRSVSYVILSLGNAISDGHQRIIAPMIGSSLMRGRTCRGERSE